MNKIANLLAKSLAMAGGSLQLLAGTCEKHGPSETLVQSGTGWRCATCFDVAITEQVRADAAKKRHEHLVKCANIPPKHKGQRFTATTDAQKAVRTLAIAFREAIAAREEWATLILMGENGTGKTLLACEFAEMYMAKFLRSVRYTTAHGMIAEIQSSYSAQDGRTEDGEIERFAQYDLLIIDEIDVKRGKENSDLLLNEVVNRRYNNGKPVIAITNQPFDKLGKFVGARVDDRLHENAFVCSFDWPSFRRNPVPGVAKPVLQVVR